jgi:hypothetical protein
MQTIINKRLWRPRDKYVFLCLVLLINTFKLNVEIKEILRSAKKFNLTETFIGKYVVKNNFPLKYTGHFTSNNDPDGIKNATHNTFLRLMWIFVFYLKNIKQLAV